MHKMKISKPPNSNAAQCKTEGVAQTSVVVHGENHNSDSSRFVVQLIKRITFYESKAYNAILIKHSFSLFGYLNKYIIILFIKIKVFYLSGLLN